MIELTAICKTYDVADQPLRVLQDVTTRIPEGGYVSVMGPSALNFAISFPLGS